MIKRTLTGTAGKEVVELIPESEADLKDLSRLVKGGSVDSRQSFAECREAQVLPSSSSNSISKAGYKRPVKSEIGGHRVAEKRYAKGLDNRMRDQDGEIRKKRSDTHIGTLRETYGPDFASGYRSDAHLGTVLRREGVDTLDQLIKKKTN